MTLLTVTHRQIRGARAMLGWSMLDLAEVAGVSVVAVKLAEQGGPERASTHARDAIRSALKAAGMPLLADEGDGEGLKLRDADGRASFTQANRAATTTR